MIELPSWASLSESEVGTWVQGEDRRFNEIMGRARMATGESKGVRYRLRLYAEVGQGLTLVLRLQEKSKWRLLWRDLHTIIGPEWGRLGDTKQLALHTRENLDGLFDSTVQRLGLKEVPA